jgi:hypothetical protein
MVSSQVEASYLVTCNPQVISMSLEDIPALPAGSFYKTATGKGGAHAYSTTLHVPSAKDYKGSEGKERHEKALRFLEFVYARVGLTAIFESRGAIAGYADTLSQRCVGRCNAARTFKALIARY